MNLQERLSARRSRRLARRRKRRIMREIRDDEYSRIDAELTGMEEASKQGLSYSEYKQRMMRP